VPCSLCWITHCFLQDQKLADKLAELKSAGTPWVGSFLLKDQKPRTDGSPVLTAAEGGEGTEDLRGEELFKRLNEYGTFAQVGTGHCLAGLFVKIWTMFAVPFQLADQL